MLAFQTNLIKIGFHNIHVGLHLNAYYLKYRIFNQFSLKNYYFCLNLAYNLFQKNPFFPPVTEWTDIVRLFLKISGH